MRLETSRFRSPTPSQSHKGIETALGEDGFNSRKECTNDGGNANGKASAKEMPKNGRTIFRTSNLWRSQFRFAILSLAMAVVISHQSGKQLQQTSRAVTHTREVLDKVESIVAS